VLLLEDAMDEKHTWILHSGGAVLMALPFDEPVESHLERGAVQGIAWSPDGKRFISCAVDNVMYLYTLGHPHSSSNYTWHSSTVPAVAWSPDGRHIASGDTHQELHIWEAAEEATVHPRGDASASRILVCRPREQAALLHAIRVVAFSPDSHFVATGSEEGQVRTWHVTTGQPVSTWVSHQCQVNALAWSPDGTTLAAAGSDMTVQAWQVLSYQTSYDLHETALGELRALAFSPDGRYFLLGGAGQQAVRLYDAKLGRLSRHIPLSRYGARLGVSAVTYSPGGRLAAAGCADGSVQIVDLERGEHMHTFHGHRGSVNAVAWSPDGVHLASGGQDKYVLVWTVGEYANANTERPS